MRSSNMCTLWGLNSNPKPWEPILDTFSFFNFLILYTTQQKKNLLKKSKILAYSLVRWVRICFYIFSSVLSFWDIKSTKNTVNALIEWLLKATTWYFTKTKVYVVSFILCLVFTVFGIFLATLVCLKSV
jgi:hypothetical protein